MMESTIFEKLKITVLDYGCGSGGFEEIDYQSGRLYSWLLDYGGDGAYGIDINPLRVEIARRKIANGTQFVVMDGRKLDYPDGFFDLVHEFGVFHHMPDYELGIREIYRVLKPGGWFILTESVDNDLAFRLVRRVFNKWQDDYVSTYFDSHELDRKLLEYFFIDSRSYHWRCLASDFLRQYNLEPRFSLLANEFISKVLNRLGLGERTCCHYEVRARKSKVKS